MGFSKVMVTGLFLSSGPKVAVNRGQMLWRPGKMYNPSHSRDLPVMGEVISGMPTREILRVQPPGQSSF